MKNSERSNQYKRNDNLERTLKELEELLGPVEGAVSERFDEPSLPQVFIIGCARSGTTLLFQYLASSGLFSYPSNIISRFYYAPYIGAKIQSLLYDLDDKGELLGATKDIAYHSDLGKTKGPVQPHEFWYFWNRFVQFEENQVISQTNKEKMDIAHLRREVAAFESVKNRPILMKAMNFNWELDFLASIFPNAYFIHVKREVVFNAQSLLLSREKYFDDRNKWYSFRPPEFEKYDQMSALEQVVSQVKDVHQAIDSCDELSHRIFEVKYEQFCLNPKNVLLPILSRIGLTQNGSELTDTSFISGNEVKISELDFSQLKRISQDLQI